MSDIVVKDKTKEVAIRVRKPSSSKKASSVNFDNLAAAFATDSPIVIDGQQVDPPSVHESTPTVPSWMIERLSEYTKHNKK